MKKQTTGASADSIKRSGKKAIITVSMDPQVLLKLDAWADERGLSRAAAISLAVHQLGNSARTS